MWTQSTVKILKKNHKEIMDTNKKKWKHVFELLKTLEI